MASDNNTDNLTPYEDVVEQLNKDKKNLITQLKDCDSQINNFQKKKLLNEGALQYIELFLQRFKYEKKEEG